MNKFKAVFEMLKDNNICLCRILQFKKLGVNATFQMKQCEMKEKLDVVQLCETQMIRLSL